MPSFVRGLRCSRCDREADHRVVQHVCPACASPLLVEYDLEAVGRALEPADLLRRQSSMWRYRELLPVEDPNDVVTLGEGWTPLLPAGRAGTRIGLPGLLVKDEGRNPTGTFKDRGAACGIARAAELGVREVALPTAGNAGTSWSAYGAAAGLRVHVAMPGDAPEANRLACELFGAEVVAVDGLISDAAAVIADGVAGEGWFDAGTLREPYRIEGKKTLGLEIAEQLEWRLPAAIVYPAGGGVGIIGIWRGLAQLRELGWVDGPLPRLIVVQAEGCAPLVRAFEEGAEESTFWTGARTFAAGLRVPKAFGDRLVLRAIRETGGTAVAVSDEAIAAAMRVLAEDEGLFASPEGAATYAGAGELRRRGELQEGDRVVLVNTGSAAGYPAEVAWALAQATPNPARERAS